MAAEPQTSSLPVIDLEPFYTGTSELMAETGKQVFEAFKNHGVPQALVDEAFEWSARFFALPQPTILFNFNVVRLKIYAPAVMQLCRSPMQQSVDGCLKHAPLFPS